MTSLDKLLEVADRLPTFPASAARLLQRLNDPKVKPQELEAVLTPDPLLTARVLKLANSSYYRSVGKVGSVKDAVVRLGLKPLFGLVTGSALSCVVPQVLPGYRIDAKGYLEHSAAVAVLSERLARRFAPDVDSFAFTAGLLHDLGKLVVGTHLANDEGGLAKVLEGGGLSVVEAERSLLSVDHAEVGERVCLKWNLPELIASAARWHHAPLQAPTERERRLASVLHLADGLSYLFGLSADVGGLQRRLDGKVVEMLKVPPGELELIVAESMEPVQALVATLGTEAR